MIDFIQNQLEAADRLIDMMTKDHNERVELIQVWMGMNTNLIKKIEERDQTIERLRAQLAKYES
jgi:hypothetical protein